jgi:agarase
MIPYVDVFSYNCYFLVQNIQDKQKFQEIIQKHTYLSGKPVMITEFSFLGADAGYPNKWPEESKYPKPGILEVMVENQKERAESTKSYIKALIEIPQVIGYHWFQYADYPFEGRANDGVAANYGLVKINDESWEKLTVALSNINKQAEKIQKDK